MAKKYIDADKLLDIIIKMQKEYATQEVAEDHKGLRAVLGGQCLVLTEIIEIIDSLQQEQPEVDLEEELENFAKQYPMEDPGSYRNLITLARHFAEWGATHLNAKKEK